MCSNNWGPQKSKSGGLQHLNYNETHLYLDWKWKQKEWLNEKFRMNTENPYWIFSIMPRGTSIMLRREKWQMKESYTVKYKEKLKSIF